MWKYGSDDQSEKETEHQGGPKTWQQHWDGGFKAKEWSSGGVDPSQSLRESSHWSPVLECFPSNSFNREMQARTATCMSYPNTERFPGPIKERYLARRTPADVHKVRNTYNVSKTYFILPLLCEKKMVLRKRGSFKSFFTILFTEIVPQRSQTMVKWIFFISILITDFKVF